jgi:hypothetical protein
MPFTDSTKNHAGILTFLTILSGNIYHPLENVMEMWKSKLHISNNGIKDIGSAQLNDFAYFLWSLIIAIKGSLLNIAKILQYEKGKFAKVFKNHKEAVLPGQVI